MDSPNFAFKVSYECSEKINKVIDKIKNTGMMRLMLVIILFVGVEMFAFGNTLNESKNNKIEIKVLMKKFESNPSDIVVAKKLLESMSVVGLDTKHIVKQYFETQSKEKYLEEYNWEIIREYASDILSEPLNYVYKNKEKFIDKYSREEVFQKLDYSCVKYLDILYKKDVVKFSEFLTKIQKSQYEHKDVIQDYFGIRELLDQKKEDEYFYKARKLFRYFPEDREMIKEITSGALKIMNDVSRLKVIQLWAGKTVEKGQDVESFYKYSKLSYKVGYNNVGLSYAKQAVILAEKNNNTEYLEKCRSLLKVIENSITASN